MSYVLILPRYDYAIGITGAALNNPEMTDGFLSQLMFRLNQHASTK